MAQSMRVVQRVLILLLVAMVGGCRPEFDEARARRAPVVSQASLLALRDLNAGLLPLIGELYSHKKADAGSIALADGFMGLLPRDSLGADIEEAWERLFDSGLAVDFIAFRSDSVIRYQVKTAHDRLSDEWYRVVMHEIIFSPRPAYNRRQCEEIYTAVIDPEWSTAGYICKERHWQ